MKDLTSVPNNHRNVDGNDAPRDYDHGNQPFVQNNRHSEDFNDGVGQQGDSSSVLHTSGIQHVLNNCDNTHSSDSDVNDTCQACVERKALNSSRNESYRADSSIHIAQTHKLDPSSVNFKMDSSGEDLHDVGLSNNKLKQNNTYTLSRVSLPEKHIDYKENLHNRAGKNYTDKELYIKDVNTAIVQATSGENCGAHPNETAHNACVWKRAVCCMGWIFCCPLYSLCWVVREKPVDQEDLNTDDCYPCWTSA